MSTVSVDSVSDLFYRRWFRNHQRKSTAYTDMINLESGVGVSPSDWRQLYRSRAKLKAASSTSALLAGFAMVALVELDLSQSGSSISTGLLVVYGVCTTLLVSVHLLALMMSTCMLPEMEAITNLHSMTSAKKSPHIALKPYINTAWFFSTCLGLLLFLAEIGVVFWVKFLPYSTTAAYVTTAMLIPVFALLIVFTFKFYRQLTTDQVDQAKDTLDHLEKIMAPDNGFALPVPDTPLTLSYHPSTTRSADNEASVPLRSIIISS